ncbi:MAG TPA: hypothetical protein VFV95_21945 [Vicinamibacterales bacterium]|nr:hypothetical protein [Vicinamibacterales bacterium]
MQLLPNQPVETATPGLTVDAGLPPGTHRIRLVVVSAHGQASKPAEVAIRVLPRAASDHGRPGAAAPPRLPRPAGEEPA